MAALQRSVAARGELSRRCPYLRVAAPVCRNDLAPNPRPRIPVHIKRLVASSTKSIGVQVSPDATKKGMLRAIDSPLR
jgi:hypothetical protein